MSGSPHRASPSPRTFITGIGSALPEFGIPQAEIGSWIDKLLDRDDHATRVARRIFKGSNIESRYSVLPELGGAGPARLYRNALPPLSERMRIFEQEAPVLATTACERALDRAGIEASDVTHLIAVTSTGASAPGPDVEIAHRLGLASDVPRTLISMMGCSGAFNGLRVGRREVELDPAARALVVCVELCSIHLQDRSEPEQIVAQALFGDAAAAVVLRSDVPFEESVAELGTSRSQLHYDLRDRVTWQLGSDGFDIYLAKSLVGAVSDGLPELLEPLIRELGPEASARDIVSWAMHPGGARLLNTIEADLALAPESLASSRQVYESAGNLSSTSVLFVLEREMGRHAPGTPGVLVGVGPGLTLEALAFRHGGKGS